jgi:hypothetical protein
MQRNEDIGLFTLPSGLNRGSIFNAPLDGQAPMPLAIT